MSTCRALLLAVALALPTHGVALAFDPDAVFGKNEQPSTVLRYGVEALKGGRVDDAIGAFSYGAEHDHVGAQWKLARMLETGDGVPRDAVTARKLYSGIVQRFSTTAPSRFERPYVAASLVSLGSYALNGLDGAVAANPRQAEGHFYRAAALFRDAEAQYRLGNLYRSTLLGEPQIRSAVRWLGLAARKGHPDALAELGQMLFRGDGVPRRPARGLAYLARAAAASPSSATQAMHDEAMRDATDAERALAARLASKWIVGPQPRTYGLAATTN
ncbi:MAG: tetratricopeptide repeat protein [Pseudomonadota bacterium]